MNTPRKSLADAFSGADRGKALTGTLAPRTNTAPKESTAKPGPHKEPSPAPADKAPKKRTSQTVDNQTVVNVGIYLDPAFLEQLTKARKQRDTTYADLLVEAFDTVNVDELTDHFSASQSAPVTPGQMPRAAKPQRPAAGIQRQFRLTIAQRDFLDHMATTTGAPSRSALAATVLKKYLTNN